MNKLLLWFAYFLVITTPLQILFCIWVYSFLFSSEYSLLTFSTSEFMDQTILVHVKLWMYSWFWNDLLDFLWSLPAAIMVTLKLITNSWLGLWLLPKARMLNKQN